MSKKYVQPGDMMNYTASAAISSGDPVLVGVRLGVAEGDIANGGTGVLAMTGVHTVRKATGAITQGAALYWDADGNPVGGASGAGALTTTSTDNTLAGYAFKAAGSSDTTVEIKINA